MRAALRISVCRIVFLRAAPPQRQRSQTAVDL